MDIFKLYRNKNSEINNPEQFKDLIKFYKEIYSKMISNNETIYYNKLRYILSYEAKYGHKY